MTQETVQYQALLRRALPMLERLGDFIGNGEPTPGRADSLGDRCDLILDIKRFLDPGETLGEDVAGEIAAGGHSGHVYKPVSDAT